MGGWVGPRVSLDDLQQRKISTGIEQHKLLLCMANYAHLKMFPCYNNFPDVAVQERMQCVAHIDQEVFPLNIF
jgi:hypothetical protein